MVGSRPFSHVLGPFGPTGSLTGVHTDSNVLTVPLCQNNPERRQAWLCHGMTAGSDVPKALNKQAPSMAQSSTAKYWELDLETQGITGAPDALTGP